MPTNNNNTDNNKGKEVEKQTNRRSPRFSGSGDIAGNVISPDGAADGLSGTSGTGTGTGGDVSSVADAGGRPPAGDHRPHGGESEGGNGGNGGAGDHVNPSPPPAGSKKELFCNVRLGHDATSGPAELQQMRSQVGCCRKAW